MSQRPCQPFWGSSGRHSEIDDGAPQGRAASPQHEVGTEVAWVAAGHADILELMKEEEESGRGAVEALGAADRLHLMFERVTRHAKRHHSGRWPPDYAVTTGIRLVDAATGGFHPRDFVVVGGRPGAGKTAFLETVIHRALALHAPPDHPSPDRRSTLVVSAGEGGERLVERLSVRGAAPVANFRSGKLRDHEFRGIVRNADMVHKTPLYLTDVFYPVVSEITDLIATWATEIAASTAARSDAEDDDVAPLAPLVVIDSVQQISPSERMDTRHRELADVVRRLRRSAAENGCVLLASSSLNRSHASRDRKWPLLSDLRESGTIEDEADVVLLLDREPHDDDSTVYDGQNLIVAKNRFGSLGRAWVTVDNTGFMSEPPEPPSR